MKDPFARKTRVIGQFIPVGPPEQLTRLFRGRVMLNSPWELQFRQWLADHGLVLDKGYNCVEVRGPVGVVNAQTGPIHAGMWHRDWSIGSNEAEIQRHNSNERNRWFVVWSNERPTEVRVGDPKGPHITVREYDVLLVCNDEVVHRTPPGLTDTTTRWFIRASVQEPIND